MESNTTYQQEIDLKDLMFAVLRKWRLIILVALVFAVLLGGVKTAKGLAQLSDEEYLRKNQETYVDGLEQYEKDKTRLEKEISNIEDSISEKQNYGEKSILMRTNPYDVYVETVTYYIATDYVIMPGMTYQNPNTASSIMKAYLTIAQNGEMYSYVLSKMDDSIELRFLKELVTVDADFDNSILTIKVTGDTKENASRVMGYIRENLDNSHELIAESIGEHELSLVDATSHVSVDLDLEKKQEEHLAAIEELEESLKTKKKELEELKEPENSLLTKRSVMKGSIKYAVLGGVLGAFMVVFFVCVAFLMSDKMVSEKELRRRYGVMILGVFSRRKKSGVFAFVDRFLDRLEGVDAKELAEDEVFEVAAANAMNYMEDVQKVLLIGTVDMAALEKLQNGIAAFLPGVSVLVGGNLGKDAQAIRKVADCDAVIVAEQRQKSLFGNIEQELDVVRSLDKKILGCIVL